MKSVSKICGRYPTVRGGTQWYTAVHCGMRWYARSLGMPDFGINFMQPMRFSRTAVRSMRFQVTRSDSTRPLFHKCTSIKMLGSWKRTDALSPLPSTRVVQ